MMQTFSASNAHKSNTVSGADATTAGHIAMTLIERELLNAGAGLTATPARRSAYSAAEAEQDLEPAGHHRTGHRCGHPDGVAQPVP